MQKVTTHDGSETFLNVEVNESYHSYTGAVEEAREKFCIPAGIKALAQKGSFRLLDVCFGMGYNSAMAISIALLENPDCKIEVVGLENDPKILEKIQEVNPTIPFFEHYKKLSSESLEFTHENVTVKVLMGDAHTTVKELHDDSFDVVFYDPFSPKTAPCMWCDDLFTEIYRVMKKGAVLTTYSCARIGRDNMVKAGLIYEDGPKIGRRGPGTVATKE